MPRKKPHIEELEQAAPLRGPSAAEAYPELLRQWDKEQNCGFSLSEFGCGSNVSAYWRCWVAPDHGWKSPIYTVVRSLRDAEVNKVERPGAFGCPFCRGLAVSKSNSLKSLRPDLAREWDQRKNKFGPGDVTAGSNKKVWWICPSGHSYKAEVSSRTSNDSGCRRCNRGAPTDLRHYKTALSQFDYENNPGVDALRLPVGMKVNWICPRNKKHKWTSGFYRTTKGERCPYCRNAMATPENDLRNYPDIAHQLDSVLNDGLRPRDVPSGSHMRLTWRCPKGPDHIWNATVVDRVQYQTGCPYCANKRISVTNSLAAVAPETASEWHPKRNKGVFPKAVIYASRFSYWWKCAQGHEWRTSPYCRTVRGHGCKVCSGVTVMSKAKNQYWKKKAWIRALDEAVTAYRSPEVFK